MRYQQNSRNELGSAILSPNFEALDENDGFVCPENLPPITEVGIHSTETLQITLTKSFLSVLKTLVESFSPSAMEQYKMLVVQGSETTKQQGHSGDYGNERHLVT